MLTKRLLWDGESNMADQVRGAVYRDETALLWNHLTIICGGTAPRCPAFVPVSDRTQHAAAVAANVAVHLASAGKPTFLVDADLRAPQLAKLNTGPSLDVLIEREDALADVPPVDAVGPLRVLASDRPVPAAAAMRAAEGLPRLLERLFDLADHVVLASPPILGTPEAVPVLSRCDGAILVACAVQQRTDQVQQVVQALSDIRIPLLGSVLAEARYPLPTFLGG